MKNRILAWYRTRLASYKAIFAIFVLLLVIIVLQAFITIVHERARAIEATIREKQALNEVVALSVASAEIYTLPAYKRQIVREVAKAPDVLYCRIVKPSGEIYLSNILDDPGKMIRDPALLTDRTLIRDDFYNGEEIKVIVSPTARGYTVWLGFSLREAEALRRGRILSNSAIAASLLLAAIVVYVGLASINRRLEEAMAGLKEYSERLEEMVDERTKELRDAQEQLVRREKLAVLGQLAGGVGHELRNPLAVISNAVYYLNMVLSDADETTATAREYLEMIASEVRNSGRIVSDLLDFSRTRSPEREETAISELVAQVLEKQPPPEKVEVTTRIASDLPPVFVDPWQIEQVLVNLVTNAYQAMAEGGRLTIVADLIEDDSIRIPQSAIRNRLIRIRVSDTGCGIPEENMGKVFEPLFTTRTRGIGLGLALSRNLVEANGGRIEVESEVGKGSTFTVWLPVASGE